MELELFSFGECPVRLVLREDGPWFVANDVAKVLGITNVRKSITGFPDDERDAVTTSDAMGRAQQVTILSEPGLYRLIFQSRKAEAERFKKWVFGEVLPAIRKTGGYVAGGAEDLAAMKGLLFRCARGVLTGAVSNGTALAVSGVAGRWLEAHRAEAGKAVPAELPGLQGPMGAREEGLELMALVAGSMEPGVRECTLAELLERGRALGWQGVMLGDLTGRAEMTRLGMVLAGLDGGRVESESGLWEMRLRKGTRVSTWVFRWVAEAVKRAA